MLTIVYTTARKNPLIEWFFASLGKQLSTVELSEVIVVDTYADKAERRDQIWESFRGVFDNDTTIKIVEPKPTIWQGKYRITREAWWAKSNALNTGICLCKTPFIAFVDDRSVLMPGWMERIGEAVKRTYAVCGTYQKRSGVKVEDGIVTDMGIELGLDHRQQGIHPIPTDNWMGGHGALPLEWCLAVNGFPELCDSVGLEDCMFGHTLYNAGFPMKYDSQMKIIEDRTPGEIDGALKRADKGPPGTEEDKSHQIVKRLAGQRTSLNCFNIREMRNAVLAGNPFPKPCDGPLDWYDAQPISEMA